MTPFAKIRCTAGHFKYTNLCVTSCPDGFYANGASSSCTACMAYCTKCSSASVCLECVPGRVPLGSSCVVGCSSGYFNDINTGGCSSCSLVSNNCISYSSSTVCIGCSSGYLSQGKCVLTCPAGQYGSNGVCSACPTGCSDCTSSTVCTGCSTGLSLSGPSCVSSCPSTAYNDGTHCRSCSTYLDANCTSCLDGNTCTSCLYNRLIYGSSCVASCPLTTYNNGTDCISCANLDPLCNSCVNNRTCTSCSSSRFAYGSTCVTSCPRGTANNGGVCQFVSLKVSLSNTDSINNYLVEISSALVYDINVQLVSRVTLVGVDPSAYTYSLTRQSDTTYLISIQNTQSIPSTILRFVYSLDGFNTRNINIGDWSDQITSKYMAFISEGAKKAVQAVKSVAGGSMQGASVGAGSMAVLGGNPALLWTLMSLFQQFYYLSFIDVNYPANVQMFLEIFSLGSLSFIPNPLKWFVKDIDVYNLPVPKRYNDNSFSGLFLDNAGNELLLLTFVFGIFCVCKMAKKWLRRLPASIRFATNKTIGWFEWSGIIESLVTSYTDIAQAVFLQLKVLTWTSTVFALSSILCFVTLGFIVAFPIGIMIIIRKFSDHPELLTIRYETLVKDYKIDKVTARNFVPIWLIRRLIMCLCLVFLQGYPYVQINILTILMIAAILYCWVYAPYNTKKENICNTLMEIMFFGIHVVIYILVYDDHNPYFSDDQRLQLGWAIVFCCGAILVMSLGLSLFEQVRMIIRGIRMIKQLMSKKEKVRIRKDKAQPRIEDSMQTDHSAFADLRTQADQSILADLRMQTDTSSSNSPVMRPARQSSPPPRSMALQKSLRRARIASRIRELRAMNNY